MLKRTVIGQAITNKYSKSFRSTVASGLPGSRWWDGAIAVLMLIGRRVVHFLNNVITRPSPSNRAVSLGCVWQERGLPPAVQAAQRYTCTFGPEKLNCWWYSVSDRPQFVNFPPPPSRCRLAPRIPISVTTEQSLEFCLEFSLIRSICQGIHCWISRRFVLGISKNIQD